MSVHYLSKCKPADRKQENVMADLDPYGRAAVGGRIGDVGVGWYPLIRSNCE